MYIVEGGDSNKMTWDTGAVAASKVTELQAFFDYVILCHSML